MHHVEAAAAAAIAVSRKIVVAFSQWAQTITEKKNNSRKENWKEKSERFLKTKKSCKTFEIFFIRLLNKNENVAVVVVVKYLNVCTWIHLLYK